MTKIDDVFPVKYYDPDKNLKRNLQKQNEHRTFYEMQKTANLIVLDQVIADLKAGRRAAPQMMQGWLDHIIERLESVSQFQRNDNL